MKNVRLRNNLLKKSFKARINKKEMQDHKFEKRKNTL